MAKALTAFDEVFNRYLSYLNIDSHGLLPSTPIFPGDNSKGAIGLKGLRNILNPTRETLGQLADASRSPEIRGQPISFESFPHHSSDYQEKRKCCEIVNMQKGGLGVSTLSA